jgi:Uma2 family endonuclease
MTVGAHALPADPPRLMSIEEWESMDEDESGELVDGRLEEEEVPDSPHEVVIIALLAVLIPWTKARGGIILGSEMKFALSARRGRKPDLSIFLDRTRKLPPRGAARRPPDIMVEIVSPRPRDTRRDRVEKLRDYAAFGVHWYWLVDPRSRTLEIFKLGADGHYAYALSAAEGTVDVPGCEGLTLDLDAIWKEIDDAVGDEVEEDPA